MFIDICRQVDSKVKILDWKNAKIATLTLDLAFLLFSSSKVEVIRGHHREALLQTYLNEYNSCLEKMTPSGQPVTFEDLKADFALSAKDALLQASPQFYDTVDPA